MASAPRSTIISLPPCVLSEIFEFTDVSIKDLMNFGLTCKRFHQVVPMFNRVWRLKFSRRWPSLVETIECMDEFNWAMETKHKVQSDIILRKKIVEISRQQSRRSDLGTWDMRVYDPLFAPELGAHSMNYIYVLDELFRLKRETDICDKAKDYYLQKLHQYVSRKYLAHEWRRFTALPMERQTKDWLVDLLIQWFIPWSPLVTIEVRAKRNNSVAAEIRAEIAKAEPCHPINSVSREVIERWNEEHLKDNEWDYDDSLPVLNVLSQKMYSYWAEDKVKRKEYKVIFGDQKIPQAIFFECIARRVGLNCEAFGNEQDVYYYPRVRWIPRYDPSTNDNTDFQCICISPENSTEFLDTFKYRDLYKRPRKSIGELLYRLVTKEFSMSGSFESVLELLHMREPQDVTIITRLINVYMKRRASIAGFIEALENICNDENVDPSLLNNMSRSQLLRCIEKCKNYEKKRKSIMLKSSDWLLI